MKSLLVVAEIALISPTCSIIEAIAMGAITTIALTLNFANWKLGKPTKLEDIIVAASIIALPSALVTPQTCMIIAAT